MIRSLLLSSIFVTLAAPAIAADIGELTQPVQPADIAPVFVWTGGYIGLQGGGGWLNGDFDIPGTSLSQDFDGGLLSGFAGYNYQVGDWVFGIEGDLGYNWNEENLGTTPVDVRTDIAGSVRGRVGYAFDNALFYATAGWAATRFRASGIPGTGTEKETFHGWTVGAGLDYAFTNNIFARAEYRYNDYGDRNILGTNVDLDQHQVTIGLGVKF
jgi:outer membrane immunogenic protein